LPTLLNFEKEKGKFANLEVENVKLLGKIATYEKELIKYHARSHTHKQTIATQTSDVLFETQDAER